MSKLAGKAKVAVKVATNKNMFKTEIGAQMASAGPPLGPLLGQYGLNISNFCKDFNEKTKNIKKGIPLPITVRIKPDRTFTITTQTPPISYFLKQAAGIQTAKIPEDEVNAVAGKLTIKHIYEIAKIKYEDPYGVYQVMDFPEVIELVNEEAWKLGIDVVKELDPEEYKQFLEQRVLFLEEVEKKNAEIAKAKLQRL